eukprot:340264_1
MSRVISINTSAKQDAPNSPHEIHPQNSHENDGEKTPETDAENSRKSFFAESTHQYFFGKTQDPVGFVIASGVIILQWVSYVIFIEEAHRLYKEEPEHNKDAKPHDFLIGTMLLAFYLMGDVLGSLRVFFLVSGACSKFAALIVAITATLGAYTGSLFVAMGLFSGSIYDALANCIGVIFVHDLDEKVFYALQDVVFSQKLKNCC